jgi:hypothetical protein
LKQLPAYALLTKAHNDQSWYAQSDCYYILRNPYPLDRITVAR